MILGLDISSNVTGASIVDRDNELIYCKAWRTDKQRLSFYDKLDIIKDKICFIKTQFPIEKVFVEEPLGMFAAGRSSAQVIAKLQSFNGAACWIVRDVMDIEPQHINAATARKSCGITVSRGTRAKEVVLNYLLKNEEKFNIDYTRHGNPIKGEYDRADSIIIARAGYHLHNKEKSK